MSPRSRHWRQPASRWRFRCGRRTRSSACSCWGRQAGVSSYTAAERQILSNSGEVFALMLENARLTDRAVEQEKVRRDLALAAEVQRRLLPPQPPRSAARHVRGIYPSRADDRGRLLRLSRSGGEQVGIAVADVSGKGHRRRAADVGRAGFAARDLSGRDLPLSQLAARMNGFSTSRHGSEQVRDLLLRAGRGARSAAALRQRGPQSAVSGAPSGRRCGEIGIERRRHGAGVVSGGRVSGGGNRSAVRGTSWSRLRMA